MLSRSTTITELQHHTLKQWRTARVFWPRLPIEHPELRFDLRGKVAGQCRFYTSGLIIIRYNAELAQTYGETFFKRTVPHEVAHAVVRLVYGPLTMPHGREWKSVMHKLGVAPSRCHSYVTTPARRVARPYTAACECRTHEITNLRYTKIKQGIVYVCKRCGSALKDLQTKEG